MTEHCRHELIAGTPTTLLRIYAIRLPNGDCPALEWLKSLSRTEQPAIGSRLERFVTAGWLRSPDAFRKLSEANTAKSLPRVDEIKHVGRDLRLYVVDFSPGSPVVYVTHGSKKPKKKQVAREVDKARAIYREGKKP